jgi:hypothetical protein
MSKTMQVVSFDSRQFDEPSPKSTTRTYADNMKGSGVQSQSKTFQELSALNDLQGRDLYGKLQSHMDDLQLKHIQGKNRRRYQQLVALRQGELVPEKPPRVPSKILQGMRAKAKKRRQASHDHPASQSSNRDIKMITEGKVLQHPLLVGDHFSTPVLRTLNAQRYLPRDKELERQKEHERGMMLSRRLQKRQK